MHIYQQKLIHIVVYSLFFLKIRLFNHKSVDRYLFQTIILGLVPYKFSKSKIVSLFRLMVESFLTAILCLMIVHVLVFVTLVSFKLLIL